MAMWFGCAMLACTTREARPSSPTSEHLTLFLSAQVQGYLGPCGCSENMRGGISRAAQQLAEARAQGHGVLFVDVGDGLFGTPLIPPEAVAQQERKALALAQAWKAMGLWIRLPGPLDNARGTSFREHLGLPELKEGHFQLKEGVALVSAATVEQARATAVRARTAGAMLVVAAVPKPFEELIREVPPESEVELWVSSRARDELAAEANRVWGKTAKVVQLQSKGRSLLRVDVHFQGASQVTWAEGDSEKEKALAALDERIELLQVALDAPMLAPEVKALRRSKLEEVIARREMLAMASAPKLEGAASASMRFVPLEANFATEPKVVAIERAYDADVGLLNVAWAKSHGVSCEKANAERPGVVGSQACVGCHAPAEAMWRKTKHPQAYASLQAVGKQYHLDCVGCHVTGWKARQGVCRIDESAGREEVGCESCHGPGSAHVETPLKTNIARAADANVCVTCHNHENSPHFDFDAYVQKIVGPGHGG